MRFIFIFFVIFTATTYAKSSYNIRLNPFTLVIGVLSLDVETKITDYATASLTYQGGKNSLWQNSFWIRSWGAKITYYTNTIKKDGYYFTPMYQNFSAKIDTFFNSYFVENENTYGLITGYHYNWFNFINLNLGIGYNYVDNKYFDKIIFFSGLLVDFSFGFDF
jgi:hypothetical protein